MSVMLTIGERSTIYTTYLHSTSLYLKCYRVCEVEVCWQFYEKVSSISCNTRRNITKKVLDFSAEVESDVQFAEIPGGIGNEVHPIILEQEDGTPSWLPWTRKPCNSEKERNFVEILRHIIEGVGEPMPNETIRDPAGTGLVHTVVYINRGMPFVFLIMSLYVYTIPLCLHCTLLLCRTLLLLCGLPQRRRGPLSFTTDGCSIN